jgi:putative transposase
MKSKRHNHSVHFKVALAAARGQKIIAELSQEYKIYPYLLGGVTVDRVNQVWPTDITYIRMHHG